VKRVAHDREHTAGGARRHAHAVAFEAAFGYDGADEGDE
jgi:hypothetical protein